MIGLPSVTYQEVNNSAVAAPTLLGVHAVVIATLFGPADKPYKVTSLQAFNQLFGGYGVQAPQYQAIKRAFQRGTSFWVQRLLAPGATQATLALQTGNAASGVTVTASSFGSFANGTVGVQYTPITNGKNALVVTYSANTSLNEQYNGSSLADLVAQVNLNSNLIVMTMAGNATEPSVMTNPAFLAGGTDGTFATPAAQDAAINTLLGNFNDVTGFGTISVPGVYTAATMGNLRTIAQNRQDCMWLFEIDPTLSPSAALAFIQAQSANNDSYGAVYYSTTETTYSSDAGANVTHGCLLDVISVFAYSDTASGNVYKAPAGSKRGVIPNVVGYSTNMMSPARKYQADPLVELGVNIVGSHPVFGPVVWGASTFAQSNSSFDAINVRRTLIDMHYALMPVFQSEVFEPMDPTTWRDCYGKAKPILDAYVAAEAIAPGYGYIGDQTASVISDAKYNQPNDLQNGLYKVLLQIVPVGYIKYINFQLNVNPLSSLYTTTASTNQ